MECGRLLASPVAHPAHDPADTRSHMMTPLSR
jgi:hypothetical protein